MKRLLTKKIWLAAAIGIVVAAVGLIGGSWYTSLLPEELDPAKMGYPDYGVTPGESEHSGHRAGPGAAGEG
ncbi:MAG: hypothetical protein J0H64_10465, partial [Actinobacteria bacterium]|nr:hypothetical protein [Actinomycetota bacterium]